MTPDPSASNAITDPGQWNKYAYVGNDPVNWYDPSGLDQCPAGTVCMIYNPPSALIDLLLGGGGAMGQGGGDPNGGRDNPGRLRKVKDQPSSKGGWNTDPAGAAKTAWQYLTSIWAHCLNDFSRDRRFNVGNFHNLLMNGVDNNSGRNGGISWWDTRVSAIAARTVDSIAHNGDPQTLSSFLAGQGPGTTAATILPTANVALSRDFFTNLTQTQQIATAIHEALRVQFDFNDIQLEGLLMNWGFTPNNSGSGAITDWIATNCGKKP
jgi:hypothetical protein